MNNKLLKKYILEVLEEKKRSTLTKAKGWLEDYYKQSKKQLLKREKEPRSYSNIKAAAEDRSDAIEAHFSKQKLAIIKHILKSLPELKLSVNSAADSIILDYLEDKFEEKIDANSVNIPINSIKSYFSTGRKLYSSDLFRKRIPRLEKIKRMYDELNKV